MSEEDPERAGEVADERAADAPENGGEKKASVSDAAASTVGRPFTFGDTLLAAAAGYAICYNRVLVEEFEALNIKRHYY